MTETTTTLPAVTERAKLRPEPVEGLAKTDILDALATFLRLTDPCFRGKITCDNANYPK